MTLRAPVKPGAPEYSDGGRMGELPDDGETASIVQGKETGTPIKIEPSPAPEPKIGPSKLARFSPWESGSIGLKRARVERTLTMT